MWRRWRAKENRRRDKLDGKLRETNVETLKHPKQWQLDYQLEDTGPLGLYQEYSEMGAGGFYSGRGGRGWGVLLTCAIFGNS